MSIAYALALLLVASAQTEAPLPKDTPVRCDEEKDSCRDGCSLDFGSSAETRKQLTTCLDRCDERRDVCLLRIVAKQREQAESGRRSEAPAPEKGAETKPAPQAPYTLPPVRYGSAPPAEAPAEELPPAKRTTTRAAPDATEPESLTKPSTTPEKEDASEATKPGKGKAKKKAKKAKKDEGP